MLSIGGWRKRPHVLGDKINWGMLLEPAVVLNKDGSFMSIVRFRGHDIDSSTDVEKISVRAMANNALRRQGSGWCLHIEAQRRAVAAYPDSTFPDPVSQAFDDERREAFEGSDAHFETRQFLVFTYLPPSDVGVLVKNLLVEGEEQETGADYATELKQFKRTVEATCDLLRDATVEMELLAEGELLTYLHSTVTDHPIRVAMPDVPMDLDCLLCNARFLGGLAPRLGDLHLRTVAVRSWPNTTVPAMLDRLNSLGIEYRWVVRWMPYSREDGLRKIGRVRQLWFGKRKNMKVLLGEAIAKKETDEFDNEALSQHDDAEVAFSGLTRDLYSFGHFTLTITTQADTADEASSRARTIRQILDGLGMVSVVEQVNAVDAWFGSLPGNHYADARRPILNSLNLCDLLPISSLWAGEEHCEHLNGPALLHASARGATPFRLNLFDGDVGHTMILGPTGAGKSTLLGTLAAQFRRYSGAQVYFFDVGKSSRALTKAVGGEFHDLGSRTLYLQPLRHIDQESERIWARDWLTELIRIAGVEMDTAQSNTLWSAIVQLSHVPPKQRTLTGLHSFVQDRKIKSALQQYTISGTFGSYLDAERDTLSSADWQAFEMEQLKDSPALMTPVLLYIFHVLERRFATESVAGAPTLLILDEAWSFLDNSLFAAKIRSWLKTLRKRNVAVIFASQSLSDVAASGIASALIESCPTTIYLPNPTAQDPSTAAIYRTWGLTDAELRVLSEARKKREYYFRSKRGRRLFNLELGEYALALVGASDKRAQALMDEADAAGLSGPAFVEWFRDRLRGGDAPAGEGADAATDGDEPFRVNDDIIIDGASARSAGLVKDILLEIPK